MPPSVVQVVQETIVTLATEALHDKRNAGAELMLALVAQFRGLVSEVANALAPEWLRVRLKEITENWPRTHPSKGGELDSAVAEDDRVSLLTGRWTELASLIRKPAQVAARATSYIRTCLQPAIKRNHYSSTCNTEIIIYNDDGLRSRFERTTSVFDVDGSRRG